MYFCWAKSQFGRISLTGVQRPGKYVLKLRVVVDKLQQGFTVRTVLTDAKQVFCCRVQRGDE